MTQLTCTIWYFSRTNAKVNQDESGTTRQKGKREREKCSSSFLANQNNKNRNSQRKEKMSC